MAEGKISVLKFKVIQAEKEDRARWKHLGNQIKRITNAIRRVWLVEHTKLGNDHLVRKYMEDTLAWHKADSATRGLKPKCGVKVVTPEIQKVIYEYIATTYGDVHARPKALAMNLAVQRLSGDKGSKSSFPRWMLILADDGEYPSSSHPQPIPFDTQNCSVVVPVDDAADFHIRLRLDRVPIEGRKAAGSTVDLLKIQTRGRRCASQTAALWKVAGGEYDFCGSNLVFRESTGEWFVHICYRMPEEAKPELQPNKVAVLRAGKKRPWMLRSDSFSFFAGGRSGRHIEHVRRQLLTQRWGRQEGYQHAGSARKGHGRKRAIGKLFLLQNRWKDFVKTVNQQLVREVIDRCISKQVGTIVYRQPAESSSRFLHNAGKVPGRTDGTSWDWYQVGSLLSVKCQEAGIKLIVKKTGERTEAKVVEAKPKRKPRAASAKKAKQLV